MNHEELMKAYKSFFERNEAGKYFMSEINRIIDDAHTSAEKQPELARDYVQRAKGAREVLDHIVGVGTEIKKGGCL